MDNDNSFSQNSTDDLINFLGIKGKIADIYRVNNLKQLYPIIKSLKLNNNERAVAAKRIIKIMQNDNDFKNLVNCLEFLPRDGGEIDSEFWFREIRKKIIISLRNAIRDPENILVYLIELPIDHIFYEITDMEVFRSSVSRNIDSICRSFTSLERQIDFICCDNFKVKVLESINMMTREDLMKKITIKFSELIKNVNDQKQLQTLSEKLDNRYPLLKAIISDTIVSSVISEYDHNSSIVKLFQCYDDVKNITHAKERLKYIILDPVNAHKGLNDICEYMSQTGKIFINNQDMKNLVSDYLDGIKSLDVLVIFYFKVFKIEPKDAELLALLKYKCIRMVTRVSIDNPEQWFLEYIRNRENIPFFIKDEFTKKVKEILGV